MTGVLAHLSMLEQRDVRRKEKIKRFRDQIQVLLAEIDSLKNALRELQERNKETTPDVKENFS